MQGREPGDSIQRQSSSGGAGSDYGPVGCIVGHCPLRLWGLSQEQRWKRWLARAGVADCRIDRDTFPTAGSAILVRADYVLEESLAAGLVERPGRLLVVDRRTGAAVGTASCRVPVAAHVAAEDIPAVAALLQADIIPTDSTVPGRIVLVGPTELAGQFDRTLRRRAEPFVLSVVDLPIDVVERQMFRSAYKGVTDLVTKWLWPLPARHVTRIAARHNISANSVTSISLIFVILALVLFATGHFLSGLAAAWAMTFLDTVDGKLARLTLTANRRGEVYDHGIDLIHPPFWYAAWWLGLEGESPTAFEPYLDIALWVILLGYLVGRLEEGLFIWLFGMEIHAWRRVDSRFRLITARRNPNLILLSAGVVVGRPDWGFILVALWTVVCQLFHGVRILQALWQRRREGVLHSWLAEGSGSASP